MVDVWANVSEKSWIFYMHHPPRLNGQTLRNNSEKFVNLFRNICMYVTAKVENWKYRKYRKYVPIRFQFWIRLLFWLDLLLTPFHFFPKLKVLSSISILYTMAINWNKHKRIRRRTFYDKGIPSAEYLFASAFFI